MRMGGAARAREGVASARVGVSPRLRARVYTRL